MIKSMTGFGRGEMLLYGKNVTIEIKAVNHRYFDFSLRSSRMYGYLEDAIREAIKPQISRGKVDIYLNIESVGAEEGTVQINESLLKGYLTALNGLVQEYQLHDDITVMNVARFPDILKVQKQEENEEELWEVVKGALDLALTDFLSFREREGERLRQDLLMRVELLEKIMDEIESFAPQIITEYRERIELRMRELLQNVPFDETRLLTEVAIFADRVNVTEELVRLKSHFVEFRSMVNGDGQVGRKLDFLLQEMNREINTIGSKSSHFAITKKVVEVKAEIEKIREQIQNIE